MISQDIAHVLVDLRPEGDVKQGHIVNAVSVPVNGLTSAKDKFPADKSAPIILYADKADEAFKIVRGWGYPNTTVLQGGIEGWRKIGGQVSSGPAQTAINYVPKPRPGEISIEEFKAVAEAAAMGKAQDKLILDVRDDDEAMTGMLVGAKSVPQGQLEARIAELPKDKEIIVHCVTGVRAEMAYATLKANGLKARFLNAVIQIDKDGKYEISKK